MAASFSSAKEEERGKVFRALALTRHLTFQIHKLPRTTLGFAGIEESFYRIGVGNSFLLVSDTNFVLAD